MGSSGSWPAPSTSPTTARRSWTGNESRAWLREQFEAIAAADNRTGWHGTADPPGALGTILARRRQLLASWQRGRGLTADGAANGTGAASAVVTGQPATGQAAQQQQQQPQPEQQQEQQPESADTDQAPDDATAATAPLQQTALLAVPTANIWSKTELLIASLAAVKDKFELLVRPLCPKSSDTLSQPHVLIETPGRLAPL